MLVTCVAADFTLTSCQGSVPACSRTRGFVSVRALPGQALSYSMLLPFTTALFFTPLLGPYQASKPVLVFLFWGGPRRKISDFIQEPLTRDAYFTFVGLVTVLIGFAIYQLCLVEVAKVLRCFFSCHSGTARMLEKPPAGCRSLRSKLNLLHTGLKATNSVMELLCLKDNLASFKFPWPAICLEGHANSVANAYMPLRVWLLSLLW